MEISWEHFTLYQLGVRLGQVVVASSFHSGLVAPPTMLAILGRLIDAVDELSDTVEVDANHLVALRQRAEIFRRALNNLGAEDESAYDLCYDRHQSPLVSAALAIHRPDEPPAERDIHAGWFHLGVELTWADAEPDQSSPLPESAPDRPPTAPADNVPWLHRDLEFVEQLCRMLGVDLEVLLPQDEPDDREMSRIDLAGALESAGVDWMPVELGLLRLRRRLAARRLRPAWDAGTGELRLGAKVIRQVAGNAQNVRLVLQCFEEDEWPHRIDSPFSPLQNKTLHESIRSLNDRLIAIRFGGDGAGRGIIWDYVG